MCIIFHMKREWMDGYMLACFLIKCRSYFGGRGSTQPYEWCTSREKMWKCSTESKDWSRSKINLRPFVEFVEDVKTLQSSKRVIKARLHPGSTAHYHVLPPFLPPPSPPSAHAIDRRGRRSAGGTSFVSTQPWPLNSDPRCHTPPHPSSLPILPSSTTLHLFCTPRPSVAMVTTSDLS